MLTEALALGAEYVDVEWRAGFDDLIARTRRTRHRALDARFRRRAGRSRRARCGRCGRPAPRSVKVAVKANRLSDCVPLLDLGRAARTATAAWLLIGDGASTDSRRACCRRASARAGPTPGRSRDSRPAERADAARGLSLPRRRSESTAIYGLVGGGSVAHSVSPAMHNAAFRRRARRRGLPAVPGGGRRRLSSRSAAPSASAAPASRFRTRWRCSIASTRSIRSRAASAPSTRSASTTAAGSAATPTRPDSSSRCADRVALRGLRASVLGAGGAARGRDGGAGVERLRACGCTRATARRPQRSRCVAPVEVGPWPPEPGSWDLLVNCTPIGMYPRVDDTPLAREPLTGRLRLRPGLQPADDAAAARGGGGRLPDDRRPRHARRAGAASSSSGGPARRPPAGVMREAALEAAGGVRAR